MITIRILGLDQFVVGHYSKEHTANIAQLYESSEDLINFYAPNAMIFHNGVEQTSWSTIVIVNAPEKFRPFEKEVANYLLTTLSDFSIHLEIEFKYFNEGNRYERVNTQYPRYLASENVADDEIPFQFGEEPEAMEGDIRIGEDPQEHHHHDCDCDHDHDHKEEVFLGNAFEGFEEQLEEADKNRSK